MGLGDLLEVFARYFGYCMLCCFCHEHERSAAPGVLCMLKVFLHFLPCSVDRSFVGTRFILSLYFVAVCSM